MRAVSILVVGLYIACAFAQFSLPPVVASVNSGSIAVTGTFFQATQTVNAPVGIPVFVRLSDGTAAIVTLPVSLAALPALTTGAAVIGALVANQSVNKAQINGVAPLMGNGVTGTGSQRVTIASDNTPFTVNPPAITKGTQGTIGFTTQARPACACMRCSKAMSRCRSAAASSSGSDRAACSASSR